MMKFIYADFMKYDHEGRLILTCFGTFKDLEKYEIILQPGMRLVFYNEDETDEGIRDDLVVEGIVDLDLENERWVAKIDWDAIKNISQLSPDERARFGLGV